MDYEIRFSGMHCDGCADTLEQYLRSEPGVTRAAVSYDDERGTIAIEDEEDIVPILAAIEQMGYGAELVDPS